jgi:hypothetical protein
MKKLLNQFADYKILRLPVTNRGDKLGWMFKCLLQNFNVKRVSAERRLLIGFRKDPARFAVIGQERNIMTAFRQAPDKMERISSPVHDKNPHIMPPRQM